MFHTKITGIGHYVPERIVSNHELEKLMDTTDQWIQERTGIKERRFAKIEKKATAKMGYKAAQMAIERAGITPNDIDAIVFSTLSSDYFFPGSGVVLQDMLGIAPKPAIDLRAQCSGFIYGLSVADQFIKTGMYKTILLVASETQSVALDLTTRGRNMGVLFGDGAGAVVLQQSTEEGKGLLSTHLHADGQHAEILAIKEPGTGHKEMIYPNMHENYMAIHPQMDGKFVFKNAIQRMPEAVMEALQANNLTPTDIDMLLPHQANLRISQMVQKILKLPDDKVYNNIQKYGNTTSATIPIMMSELWEAGRIKDNQLYALTAFGSGFTWASALIRW